MPVYAGHQSRWKFKAGKVHLLRISSAGLLTRQRFVKTLCGCTIDEWARPVEEPVDCKTCNKLSYVQYSPSDVY